MSLLQLASIMHCIYFILDIVDTLSYWYLVVVIAHILVSHVWAVDEYYRVGCSVCCTVAVLPLLCGCVSCPFKAYLKPCLCHKQQELYSHPSTVLPRAMHFHVCKLLAENTRFYTCFYHTFLRNCSTYTTKV